MGYEGASIASLVKNVEDASGDTGYVLAGAMAGHGRKLIRANTPVRTRTLRDSYQKSPVRYKQDSIGGYTSIRWSAYVWESTVWTEIEYAPYVELGTGLWGPRRKKYIIRPKNPDGVLAFRPYVHMPNGAVMLNVAGNPAKSGAVIVRFVMHPGSPGHHMFRIGTTMTEQQMNEWANEPMRRWKAAVESGVRSGSVLHA